MDARGRTDDVLGRRFFRVDFDIAAICFVHGKRPHDETLDLARENQTPLFCTRFSMFEACGRLFAAGLVDEEGFPGLPGSKD